ncbi:MAG TPA: HAD family phosphatase [Candidatus Saccharimonadales bacterium]|nr:HAD family phosphatase [Candidatus Saccharimonadales bacterium]
MIKAIIFDFFGVLVTEGFSRFCDKCFPNDQEKRRAALELVTMHDWGKLSQDEYIDGLAKLAGVDRKFVEDHMEDNQANDSLLSYIRTELKPKYKVAVLSNSGDDYLSKILEKQDAELFEDIILSYQYGLVKPQSAIFDLAASRLGVEPGECVFIDDSPTHCAGAEGVGMKTIRYDNFPQMKTDLEKILSTDANN